MLYSEILISTAEHINIHFLVSNIKNAYIFSEFLKPYVQYYSEERFTFEKEKKEKTEEREKKTRTREEQEATAHNYNYREWVRPDKKSGSNKDPGNNEIVRRSQNLWAFKILGLSKSANQKEIKKAYFALVKIYHPDKHAHKNPEIFKDAEEKLKVINEAYESLKK
ncbi:MAG: DnaJ domain-containing protein [bacterium]|nr:DnaJ domain-containing protein [bacterium]